VPRGARGSASRTSDGRLTSMELSRDHLEFLAAVEQYNSRSLGVRTGGGGVERLVHPFWSMSEIESGQALRSEWDVPSHLVPFYGDWHDLLCLDSRSGSVALMDDARTTLFVWPTIEEFRAALSVLSDDPPSDDGGCIEVRLDPDLL